MLLSGNTGIRGPVLPDKEKRATFVSLSLYIYIYIERERERENIKRSPFIEMIECFSSL